ncbi:hypothetical protein DyAD56_02525 [Dyella sp. AD56]|nr:hypothetical protein DyAD56_02525 [Dyella sp. AD56]
MGRDASIFTGLAPGTFTGPIATRFLPNASRVFSRAFLQGAR